MSVPSARRAMKKDPLSPLLICRPRGGRDAVRWRAVVRWG
jgi:hypothetical protein